MALTVSNVSVSLSKKDILVDVSVGIADGSKVGLIGRNGVGKTTFLKAVLGKIDFNGEIKFDGKAAFFSQEFDLNLNKTGKELIEKKSEIHHQNEFEKQLKEIEKQLNNSSIYDNPVKANELTEKFIELQSKIEKEQNTFTDNKIKSILKLLQVKPGWMEKKISELSTGQKAIIALAQILSTKTDLLLLDEPTNHLDFKRLNILEKYLKEFKGTVIIITHDRYFLNQVCDSILKIENKKWIKYQGNYSNYLKTRKATFAAQQTAFEQEQKYIALQKDKIARIGKSPLKVKQGKYREKLLEKREKIEKPDLDESKFETKIQSNEIKSNTILEIKNLSVGYDKPLISNISFNIGVNERIVLIGENGIGKTTLFKTIEGRLPKLSGEINWNEHAVIGYGDQELKDLKTNKTLYEEIYDLLKNHGKTRQQLSLVGFNSNTEVNKSIKELSTGEKTRLNLLKILIKEPNILLLDEPTNHLDIETREILENAFLNYNGAIFAVSHDKYFIEKIAQKVLKIHNNTIIEIPLE
jgi:ATP-binding cassette, subfamily F, member 3